jgi:hypothetical protein
VSSPAAENPEAQRVLGILGARWQEIHPDRRNPFTHQLNGDGVRADWCERHGGTADETACRGWVDGSPCPGDPPPPVGFIERATWLHTILEYRGVHANPGDDGGAAFVAEHTELLALMEN